jgi:hypothetical protein
MQVTADSLLGTRLFTDAAASMRRRSSILFAMNGGVQPPNVSNQQQNACLGLIRVSGKLMRRLDIVTIPNRYQIRVRRFSPQKKAVGLGA